MATKASARAPGRVNLIGEHTDYNGGLVLPAALHFATEVEIAARSDRLVRGQSRERGLATAPLDAAPRGDWLDYVRGVARVLAGAGLVEETGFDVRVRSDVPEGAGLSSSAALEAATALALLAVAGGSEVAIERAELARLCQRAEAEFVGVPCGIMDQYAVLCCREGEALLLDCATLATRGVRIPEGVELVIADSGVARSLRAGAYAQRRAECERALQGARLALGRKLGSLSELSPADLARVAAGVDPIALRRARHVVLENERVRACAAALELGKPAEAGAELYASHESLRCDYEVSWPEGDALVEIARAIPGCFGARMTGAGFGGCTVHLVEAERAEDFGRALSAGFAARYGRAPRLLRTRASAGATLL
jgi:galactokinase